MHLPGQVGPLPPITPEAMRKASAAILRKDQGIRECRLCHLLLPVQRWTGSICTRKDNMTASHFDTHTSSCKSLLFKISVSEMKVIPSGMLAKSSLLSFQVLCKSRCSDALRSTVSICRIAHMCALFILLKLQR